MLTAIARYWLSSATPPPRLTVREWADTHRFLSKESSANAGKYRSAFAPYQRGPMDAATDRTVQSVVLMWASQVGKTELMNNLAGYFIHADPSPILVVQPTLDMGEAWSKERLAPMLRDCPALSGLVKDARSRDSGNTLLMKSFPGGSIAIAGANSPSGLASRPRRVVLLDEVDRFPFSAGTEGDPVSLAIRRTESFWNAVIYLTSTPTIKGLSRIETAFDETDQCRWFCPCPECGEFQTLEWGQVRWEDGKPETARYECKACGAKLDDAARVRMVRLGEWRATAEFKGKRGYHLNGIASPFPAKRGYKDRLHQMAAQFLDAKHGGVEQLKAWTNTFLAQTWEEEGETLAIDVDTRLENFGQDALPEKVLVLVVSADIQKDRIEAECVGYGEGEESWGIERRVMFGDTERQEVWQQLADFISKRYKHPNGHELEAAMTCIDSGFQQKATLAFVESQSPRRVYAVKGSSNSLSMPVIAPKRASRSRALMVDTAVFKSTLYQRLKIKEPGPRYMHFPRGRGYDDEFFAQLTAEKVVTSYERGRPVQRWENVRPNKRNEALDIRVYNLAGLWLLRVNWEALAKNLAKKPEAELISGANNDGQKPPTPKPPQPQRRRMSFLRNF